MQEARLRKIGATAVALNFGQLPKANLVTRQMAHSKQPKYYQAIVACAYSIMSELRKERQKTPVTDGVDLQIQEKMKSDSSMEHAGSKVVYQARPSLPTS